MKSPDIPESADGRGWKYQPPLIRGYVVAVIALGTICVVLFIPRSLPHPGLFAFTLLAACLTSVWKVNLPLPFVSGSTLSVSYAADMMALMLLGPELAVTIAVIGVWVQCTVNPKERQPKYRTIFSMAAEAVAMASTGIAYRALGGAVVSSQSVSLAALVPTVAGAFTTYFFINTGLVAGAIALSTGRPLLVLWRQEFLWCALGVMVSGAAGAAGAIVIAKGQHSTAILLLAPVYLIYWTYRMFTGRLIGSKDHPKGAVVRQAHSDSVLSEPLVQKIDPVANVSQEAYLFGPFRLDLRKRRLWKRDQLVALTPKALDTLLVLIRHAGHVVDRDDLLKAVWPDTFVSEDTLTQNIATVRRGLGDSSERPDYIATVPRRGYQFIGVVTVVSAEDVAGTSGSLTAVRSSRGRH